MPECNMKHINMRIMTVESRRYQIDFVGRKYYFKHIVSRDLAVTDFTLHINRNKLRLWLFS